MSIHYNNTCPECGGKSTCRCPSKNKVETSDLCWSCQRQKSAVVKQEGDEWLLMTRDGKRVLGRHASAREAYAQEYAIQKSQEKATHKKASEKCGSNQTEKVMEQQQRVADIKKVHDLLFYSRRSTPKILHPEEVEGFKAPENYGTMTLRRKATDEEEAEIAKGKWLRVDENGHRPGAPDYKRTSLRPALLRAKRYSDVGRYGPKNSILNKLLFENPEEFYIDSKHTEKFPGLTHGPTGFRIHAPREVAMKARGSKEASQKPPQSFQEFIDGIYKPRTMGQDVTDFVRAGLGFYGIGKGMKYSLPKLTGAVMPEGKKPGLINSIRFRSKDIPGYIKENPKTFGKGALGLLAASLLGYDFQNTMQRITHRGFGNQ